MNGLLSILSAFGLSTAAGLNAYIPLLTIGLLARYTDLVRLNDPYDVVAHPVFLLSRRADRQFNATRSDQCRHAAISAVL